MKAVLYGFLITILTTQIWASSSDSSDSAEYAGDDEAEVVAVRIPASAMPPEAVPDLSSSARVLAYALRTDIEGPEDDLMRCRISTCWIAGSIAPTVGTITGSLATIGMGVSATGILPDDVDTAIKITCAALAAITTVCTRIKQTFRAEIDAEQNNLVALYRTRGIGIGGSSSSSSSPRAPVSSA